MRLLRLADGRYTFEQFTEHYKPPYAILSHTWEADNEEVDFEDVQSEANPGKTGWRKLLFCGNQAAQDGLAYFWVDTCCIDKTNSSEVREAINSMFEWYQKAEKCYVYLSDVPSRELTGVSKEEWELAFRRSRWFKRGWTLQELIAPKVVEFYSKEQQLLGDKQSMLDKVCDATGICVEAVQGKHLFQLSFRERTSWATHRETKRPEDLAYSLLGILEISLVPDYGEGLPSAMDRLRNTFFSVRGFPGHMLSNHAKHRKPCKQVQRGAGADRASHKRPLCRSYEPLVLLYTLGGTEQDYVQSMLPNEEDTWYLPPRTTRRRFLDDLAYVSDYDSGHDTVTAIGMQSLPQSNVLWIASNSSPARQIISFVTARLTDLKHITMTVQIDRQRKIDDFIRVCIDFATPQIKDEMHKLSTALLKCKQYLGANRPEEGTCFLK